MRIALYGLPSKRIMEVNDEWTPSKMRDWLKGKQDMPMKAGDSGMCPNALYMTCKYGEKVYYTPDATFASHDSQGVAMSNKFALAIDAKYGEKEITGADALAVLDELFPEAITEAA